MKNKILPLVTFSMVLMSGCTLGKGIKVSYDVFEYRAKSLPSHEYKSALIKYTYKYEGTGIYKDRDEHYNRQERSYYRGNDRWSGGSVGTPWNINGEDGSNFSMVTDIIGANTFYIEPLRATRNETIKEDDSTGTVNIELKFDKYGYITYWGEKIYEKDSKGKATTEMIRTYTYSDTISRQ